MSVFAGLEMASRSAVVMRGINKPLEVLFTSKTAEGSGSMDSSLIPIWAVAE